jgi:hypothetical protein
MNGTRTARKYIEKQSTKELLELRKLAKEDETPEGMVVYYLIQAELERRKAGDFNKFNN